MADFTLSSYFFLMPLVFIAFFSGISLADESSLFSFLNFGKDVNFESDIAMYGDAKVVNGGSSIQLTNSVSNSSGLVVFEKPIKLVDNESEYPFPASFSTFFSFSMSHELGSCLKFVVFPAVFGNNGTIGSSLVEVEFDTSSNISKYGDSNENHVSVIVDGSVSGKISNLSFADLIINGGAKLGTWIDYRSSSKRLEIRFSKSGDAKPDDPLISCRFDLSATLKGNNEFMVGLESFNGNSSQTYSIHSWSFQVRRIPRWLHSYPFDPNSLNPTSDKKKIDSVLQVLACFITTFGSTALVFFALMYLWALVRRNNSLVMVVPEECGLKAKDFEYKKMEKMEAIVVSKANPDEESK